jgi:hypothetical protein
MALIPADSSSIAAQCAIAYKEWAGVCRALAVGRQTVLLRKGGIAESGGAFRPEYSEFWMYPTHLHERQEGLRDDFAEPRPDAPTDSIRLDLRIVVESVAWVDNLETVARLEEFHVWTEQTIGSRFHYRTPGLWVLGIRAFQALDPLAIPVLPTHAGCRTWVPLESAPSADATTPVISDTVATARREALAAALAQPNAAR